MKPPEADGPSQIFQAAAAFMKAFLRHERPKVS